MLNIGRKIWLQFLTSRYQYLVYTYLFKFINKWLWINESNMFKVINKFFNVNCAFDISCYYWWWIWSWGILLEKWLTDEKPSQLTFTCSKSTIQTLEKVWDVIKANNENTRKTSTEQTNGLVFIPWPPPTSFW